MASIFGHSIVALTTGRILTKSNKKPGKIIYLLALLSAIIPDADVLAFKFGIPYEHMFGHRGITHSIFFALIWTLMLRRIFYPKSKATTEERRTVFWILLISTLSHGVLDAMTTGGMGIAFFAPWTADRYFLPWRVIQVSPIGVSNFFSEWGMKVIYSEALYVVLPSFVFLFLYRIIRKKS